MEETTIFQNIEQHTKDIFKESLVAVKQVDNPEIRHVYIKKNLEGDQILELEKFYRILFVSQVYDEERLDQKFDAILVILITNKEKI